MEEENLGGESSDNGDDNDNDDDMVASIYSGIIDIGGDEVWGEVSVAINLIQEGVAKFQAGLSKLKNVIGNMYLAALGDIVIAYYPQFLSTSLLSIPLDAMMPDPAPPIPLK